MSNSFLESISNEENPKKFPPGQLPVSPSLLHGEKAFVHEQKEVLLASSGSPMPTQKVSMGYLKSTTVDVQ